MGINNETDSIIPGGKYHNRRDYMDFPNLHTDLVYEPMQPLNVKGFSHSDNTFDKLKEKDFMIHTPYHKFSYIISFLMKSSIDPKVKKISITIYRLSKLSKIASALINAVRNGKKVIVQIELQARFDESANIRYAKEMQSQGIKLIFGSPNLKVHSKICLIERLENGILKDDRISFFAESNPINISTTLTNFAIDAKVTGSNNQEKYKTYKKIIDRYSDRNLELIEQSFEAKRQGNDSLANKLDLSLIHI